MTKLLKISEVCKYLNLIDPKSKKPNTHVLRYWEKEFKQIKPKKINNRRYYSSKQVEIIKMVKFLLKGTVTQNIFSLKTSPNECTDL